MNDDPEIVEYMFSCPGCGSSNQWMVIGKQPTHIDALECSGCGYRQEVVHVKEDRKE